MGRYEIIEMLNRLNIDYRIEEHPHVETIEEMEKLNLPGIETVAKNLFLRDDKKRNYYLIVVRKDKKVNLKELRKLLESRPLSFASENDLQSYLGLEKGSVTPFGLMNDTDCRVCLVLDRDVTEFQSIGVHPNVNTVTVWLSPNDLTAIIKQHGNQIVSLTI